MQTLADRTSLRALRRETRRFHTGAATTELYGAEADASWDIGTDEHGFSTATSRELGRLWGLLFVQAQCDGASRIQLYYGAERRVYTIKDTDYEMVPPPAPLNVDMCRFLARASKLRWDSPGTLDILFADLSLKLMISHEKTDEKPGYVEIRGFTGNPRQLGSPAPEPNAESVQGFQCA